MRKTVIILMVLGLVAAAGAFADLSLGLNGAVYMDDAALQNTTGVSLSQQFQSGDGVYYGLMAEILGRKIGLAGSYLASFYTSDVTGYEMVNMDLNLALDAHLLGSRTIIDPIIGVGLGYIAKDFANEADDQDPDNPLTATAYWFLEGGLGLNFGPLGIFGKFLYHLPLGDGTVSGQGGLSDTELEAYALQPYKIEIGAKVMLPFIPRRR